MPIFRRLDREGSYYQYGSTGHKYYYKAKNKASRDRAYSRCLKQVRAIQRRKFYT